MNTGIDLFIADLPGPDYGYGDGLGFKPYCIEHGGVLTTPSSESEIETILEVDIPSTCEALSIAAYGAGPTDALTFYTDDSSQADELTYTKWGAGYPLNSADVARRCTYMDRTRDGVWSNEPCTFFFNHCGLCRASPSGGGGGGKLAFLPT